MGLKWWLSPLVLARRPDWYVLRYLGPKADKGPNRRAAIGRLGSAGIGKQWDEFPYASTAQGGKGAQVAAVPADEQLIQAAQLLSLYRDQLKWKPTWFIVVPLPE